MKHYQRYLRHAWPVRVMHWINVIALTVLLGSGLQIFNAHPALYWGKSSYTGAAPVLHMHAQTAPDGSKIGVTDLFGKTYRTTGLFGVSKDQTGELAERGFPSWLTLPSSLWLSMGRHWHFFFAWILVINGLLYVAYAALSGHLARDLAPTRPDWRSIGKSVVDHVRFRHPVGEAAKHYNVLQKITYLLVIFVLLPFTIMMGLAMSPRLDSVLSGVLTVVGGRQSARTLHFIGANLIVLFVVIHVFEVIISGLWNNLRSMLTGRFDVADPAPPPELAPTVTETSPS